MDTFWKLFNSYSNFFCHVSHQTFRIFDRKYILKQVFYIEIAYFHPNKLCFWIYIGGLCHIQDGIEGRLRSLVPSQGEQGGAEDVRPMAGSRVQGIREFDICMYCIHNVKAGEKSLYSFLNTFVVRKQLKKYA